MQLSIGVHIPKSGGTSVRTALQRTFGDTLLEDYSDDPELPEFPRQIDPDGYFLRAATAPEGVRCIYGHFHISKYRTVRNATRFTILRHPVDLILSKYFYWLTVPLGGSVHRYVIENRLSAIEMARMPVIRRIYTHSYFGGADMASFDFIGRHEARAATMDRLAALIQAPIEKELRENVTLDVSRREAVLHNPGIRAKLEDILAPEIDFYEKYAFRDL
jgi:hypothetical protein